jgi:ribose/xylose/arabinose/galactoside ABC-type transport system permease subunit
MSISQEDASRRDVESSLGQTRLDAELKVSRLGLRTRLPGGDMAEAAVTFAVFAAVFIGFGIALGDNYWNVSSRLLDVHQDVPILFLGLAVLVTLVGGMLDLSVASMANLTTFLAIGLVANQHLPLALVLVICVAVGAGGGLLNGFLVEKVGLNAFLATLGTSGLFDGASQVYAGGNQITPGPGHPLPSWFVSSGEFMEKAPHWAVAIGFVLTVIAILIVLGRHKPIRLSPRAWLAARAAIAVAVVAVVWSVLDLEEWIDGVSWCVAVLVLITAALWILLRFTTYGRYLRASGANRSAATLAGVRVNQTIIQGFVLGGVLAALAGIVIAAQQGTASPEVATPFLLPAFAAAFLSTVMFSTGRFTVWGTLIGGVFIVWTNQALVVAGLAPTWTNVINGVALVGAVAFSRLVRRRNPSR